ncbi:LOW QUALITY PROTEIN: uncharacterized protein LOC133361583 [Lethenteron reissneri]|uniref:LOW QUALITY PROTEIN: uncharacterized protein LOC133361583 n=1 Tax=Lethenteron reissneri TaxID=7753 RepID=UPI002AB79E3C|nr:LOW QUALITY PROTEIN: uncharacterized protein LOC133361583 [Lethenteron reissneri]
MLDDDSLAALLAVPRAKRATLTDALHQMRLIYGPPSEARHRFDARRKKASESAMGYRSALLAMAKVAYPRMDEDAVESLVLQKLMSLARQLRVAMPTADDDFTSLRSLTGYRPHPLRPQPGDGVGDHGAPSTCLGNEIRLSRPSGNKLARGISDPGHKRNSGSSELLREYADVFSEHDSDVGRTDLVKHQIDTGAARPIKLPAYRVGAPERAQIKEAVGDMLCDNIIQPSASPWSAPVVLVTKKDGSTRFCVDYHKQNAVTLGDAFPIPRIDDTFDSLAGARYFSTLDLASGYWQVEMAEEDRPKTAFTTPMGLFEFRVLPFGLTNAPATFQRLMELVMRGLQWEQCLIYLDDVIVFSRFLSEHWSRLREVFKRLRAAHLKLKPRKCYIAQREVGYLGHHVSEAGVRTDPEKVRSVVEWPRPRNLTEIRSFLGLATYYRRFVKGFSKIARPLTQIDLQGPFPRSHRGNRYILVAVEYFTRYPVAVAIPDKTALMVARAFVEHYVLKHGIPERVLTDQGSEFEAELFQALCREFGIQKDRTTAYHPQANGMVERMNQTLAGKLKRMAAANQRDWDEYLPYALFAYATTVHTSTGQTPFLMMFGRESRLPADLLFGVPPPQTEEGSRPVEHLMETLRGVRGRAYPHGEAAHRRQQQSTRPRMEPPLFSTGEKGTARTTAPKPIRF